MSSCTKCEGRRVIPVRQSYGSPIITEALESAVSCPQCGGSGNQPDSPTRYFVIWYKRGFGHIELHARSCTHGLNRKLHQWENIGGDNWDGAETISEVIKRIQSEHKNVTVEMRDCVFKEQV